MHGELKKDSMENLWEKTEGQPTYNILGQLVQVEERTSS